MDGIKSRVQNELKLNLQAYTDSFTPLNEVDEAVHNHESEVMEEESLPEEEKKGRNLSIAILLLSEATQSGYARIRKALFEQFGTSVTKEDVPSFPKKRPPMDLSLIHI